MTSWTRAEVATATPYRPLMTLETVAMDTPAVRATSVMVTLLSLSTSVTLPFR